MYATIHAQQSYKNNMLKIYIFDKMERQRETLRHELKMMASNV